MEGKQRYTHVDLIKAVGILFVCMYHFWYGSEVMSFVDLTAVDYLYRVVWGLLSTCVPLFFVASGAVMLNKPFNGKKHYRSVGIMAMQLYLWRIVTIVVLGAMNRVDFSVLSRAEFFNILFLFGWTELVATHHVWFIPMLVAVLLMYPFIKNCFDREGSDADSRRILIVSVSILFVLSFVFHDYNVFKYLWKYTAIVETTGVTTYFDPFAIRVGAMLLYFILGGYLQKYREKLTKIPAVVYLLTMLVALAISFAGWHIASVQQEYAVDNVFGGYESIPTLICTVCIFALAVKWEPVIGKSKSLVSFVQFIGKNTLSVYYVHWILGRVIMDTIYDIYDALQPYLFFPNLLTGFILIMGSILIGLVIKKIPVVGKYLL